jgi:hypothetical protein
MADLPDFGQGKAPQEMMQGSEKTSHFLVISKHNGLKLGIRPFMSPLPDKKNKVVWASMMCRLRVEVASPNGSIMEAKETFGNLNFDGKGAHASTVCRLDMAAMPVSPRELYDIWHDNKLTEKMVDEVEAMIGTTGAKLMVDKETIIEYLNLQFENDIPTMPLVTPNEFKLVNISE